MANELSELKPLYSAGGPIVDSNFEPVLFSHKQAMRYAFQELKKWKVHGCKQCDVRDLGDYRRYSIF